MDLRPAQSGSRLQQSSQGDRISHFEAAWNAVYSGAPPPRLEDYLADVPAAVRAPFLVELLTVELEQRRGRGDKPAPAEYERRFPGDTGLVRAAFASARTLSLTCDTPPERTSPPDTPLLAAGEQPAASANECPAAVGRYRVVEHLGSGGQADVYRAVHPQLPGRDVVIKWAKQSLPAASQKLLISEGSVLARLEDPGLARVHDVDVCNGRPFIVLEYVSGRTLGQLLKERRPAPRHAAAWVADVAATLERVHRQGVCHRDLKPANILIDRTGRPRLLDFGLALMDLPWGEAGAPRQGMSGTFAYMAPEQANALADRVGPRTDVFGLGAVLYALLTGRPPYEGSDPTALWEQARQARVVSPRKVQPGIPQALARICLKALAAEPEARYASAGQMGKALRGCYLRRPRLLAGALILGLAGLLAGLAWRAAHVPEKPGAAAPPGPIVGVPGAAKPLAGELALWVLKGGQNMGIPIDDPRALPLVNGDAVQVQARFNQPAYVYLLWADSSGAVQPIYPWDKSRDFKSALPTQEPRRTLTFPEAEYQELEGGGGLETAIVLARTTPLSAEEARDLARELGHLPPAHLENPREFACLELAPGDTRAHHCEPPRLARSLSARTRASDDATEQLLLRLRPRAELIQAVRFAHGEK